MVELEDEWKVCYARLSLQTSEGLRPRRRCRTRSRHGRAGGRQWAATAVQGRCEPSVPRVTRHGVQEPNPRPRCPSAPHRGARGARVTQRGSRAAASFCLGLELVKP